ncbi:LacI family DNA-binding transcriptional regulator [Streptomyces sp. DSM 44915]|uniref:LacI family DNA-binding transcriptional regulator n=1 Tax=Streptomyces chisholmiae TaxID=3075540 RepID=A0ABU2JQS0_9ACTN|nr:LacI family DNA-binding transcriptional regulator [Streptomyces sp. DSM 44915]MDT0267318.1 LacI family DNA-binding transcriptional regulator [Streptomyces sp. DSM 44915]
MPPTAADGAAGRAVTIHDVATLAGVSPGTVSKAINGRGKLRPETRERVLDAARRLGFRPNEMARGLSSGRSFTVGLVTTDSVGRFSLPVLLGAEDALGAGRISVFLCDTRGDQIREQHYVRTLLDRRIDGLIVTGRRTDPRPPLRLPQPVPVVYALGPSTDPADVSLVTDDAEGARLVVAHLLATGRRRIAHLTGPEHHLAASVRAEHTVRALREAGVELSGGRVHFGSWDEAWGRQAARMALLADPAVDALFCGNDQIARGAADALREAGRRVPDEIALVGYDNWDVMAEACRPTLTTVDMNLAELGRTAALTLMDAIDGRPARGVRTVPCRLVVRDSTGVPTAQPRQRRAGDGG